MGQNEPLVFFFFFTLNPSTSMAEYQTMSINFHGFISGFKNLCSLLTDMAAGDHVDGLHPDGAEAVGPAEHWRGHANTGQVQENQTEGGVIFTFSYIFNSENVNARRL